MKQSRHALAMLIGKYRAVIQKIWWKNLRAANCGVLRCKQGVCAGALLISLAVSPGLAAAGEIFTYTGDGTNVRDAPSWYWHNAGCPNCLFLGTVTNPLASGNTVIVNFDPNASGVILPKDTLGGMSKDGDASGNQVIFLNGLLKNDVDYVLGGYSVAGNATGNSVTISGGTVEGCVLGGCSTGSAIGNSVTISGGTVGRDVFGGDSGNGNATATGNSVTISGGTVRGKVYGGRSGSGNATGNSVTISGGTVGGNVFGGDSMVSGNATGNTVTIAGNPTLTNATLYGGYVDSGSGDKWTGNTLNVKNSGMSAKGVANFQYYNFYLPSTIAVGDTMLSVTTSANISNSTIGLYLSGGTTLKTGDSVTLLSSTSLVATNIHTSTSCFAGVARIYNFSFSSNPTSKLIATVSGFSQNPQVKALSEGQASGAAVLNQGMNMLSGQGMESARNAASSGSGEPTSFAVLGGGSFSSETGSHIDVRGISLVAGAAKEKKVGQNTLTSGLFLEHGWGNYSTYNSFTNVASVRGDGDTRYFGAGWLGRQQNSKGQYVEGSVRGGQINNNFTSNDIGAAGTTSSYDVSAPYYGLHIGIGKEANIGQNQKRDIYTKLLWTHQNGSSATVQGDQLQFDAVDSVRSQTGIKWSYKTNESTTMQIGLAYQHEFDGKADSTVNGSAIEAPSMKGNTGILAVGLTKENKNGKGPKLDIGLQGFCGKTKGVIGTTQASWNF